MVAVAKPVVLATTLLEVMRELCTVPSLVQNEVEVTGSVSCAIKGVVMTVAEERVERLIVDEPMTTWLLAEPEPELIMEVDLGEVDMCEVTEEPSELVVVTCTELGTEEED